MMNFTAEENVNETQTHDDVINQEIEQEHAEKEKRFNFTRELASEDECKKFNENLENKNLKPLWFNFNISTVKFIDMTDFNKEKYFPDEIEEKQDEYVCKICNDIEKPIRETLKKFFEDNDFSLHRLDISACPYKNSSQKDEIIDEVIKALHL